MSAKRPAHPATHLCTAVVLGGFVLQIVSVFESPWTTMGVFYLSCAALGLDAVLVGVRSVRGEGPSIRNLSPGGWAVFAAMFFVVGAPAYYAGARRRARRGYEVPVDPVGAGTWLALGGLVVAGLTLLVVG